ncbi:probable protein phosphatase 2C 60 [Punica granatum]|uniref:protein-serine/threonine phosphatase n=2 Tax=Punica granatum TaxID=22663 RepID=A0A6P8C181_PUNGR|nr:probable protein phosphatase 2C 60 [Punica granatum]XP_031376184.1 probable protein phosphatase 2C 60 [Punica granatum]XP_031376186.1 probable protein phosphatase 2C 60 [Punica granatum]XP_031376302.1 probable protein phosphatase 2C 60 [Punica granatum]XP_031376303.1 probable protein phosphatase 2C 60 [Punica granatum]XP_031376304.1 probable protein phosphatase 2C 60 [Punica granatum]
MGIYLSSPKTDKVSEDGENGRLRYGLSSMQGWRATMEDAHAAYPDLDDSTSFFGVYDGHGGKAVAKFCAKYLHQQVLKHQAYAAGDLSTSVQKAFLRMDEMMRGQRGWRELAILGDKIEKFSGMIEGLIWSPRSGEAHVQTSDWHLEEGPHSDFQGPTCGSTACVAIIRNRQLIVANAGDSRCVISRKGQAFDLSKDHKPELEVERDRILKAGGFIQVGRVNGSLNLARAIGDAEFKQNESLPAEKQIVTANPDVNMVELCDDDEFLVLACDGIWDCMSSQQLVDFVAGHLKTETKLSAVCERVFERCLAPTAGGEGCDNMTMIIVQLNKPSGPRVSAGEQPAASDPQSQPVESSEKTEVTL